MRAQFEVKTGFLTDMSENGKFQLLICSESQQASEQLSGLMRSAGHTIRAHRVTSAQDLEECLKSGAWELLLATENHPEITPLDAIKKGVEAKTPVVIWQQTNDKEAAVPWLEAGASDVVLSEQESRLAAACSRDIIAYRNNKSLQDLRGKYEEISRRAELLLETAQEAIAYVVDGMHIHCNEAYAAIFEHQDADDLVAIPLVDLIAPSDQQAFKAALRQYRDNPQEKTCIPFTGIKGGDKQFAAELTLSSASYEGEACMQVLVKEGQSAPTALAAPAAQEGSSLAAIIEQAIAMQPCHAMLIRIADFDACTVRLALTGFSLGFCQYAG